MNAHDTAPGPRGCARSWPGCVTLGRMSLSVRVLAVSAALALAVSACSGGDDSTEAASQQTSTSPSTSSTPSPSPSKQPRTSKQPSTSTPRSPVQTAPGVHLHGLAKEWPLTGKKRSEPLPNRPVYMVKIDNTSSSEPQIGLDHADLVVEELVEGGMTRLGAFYYTGPPTLVGPVRSARTSDAGIIKPVSGKVVASGAAGVTWRELSAAGVKIVGPGAPGFYRESSRSAPYNMMLQMGPMMKRPGKPWHPPTRPYLQFGDGFHGTQTVTSINAQFSGAHTTTWQYGDNGWVRTNSHAAAGHDYATETVLLLRVPVGNAGYLDPAGNPVPETNLHGSGQAVLVHGKHAIKGTWHKDKPSSTIQLTTNDGKKLTVPRGHVFIELIPADTGAISLQ